MNPVYTLEQLQAKKRPQLWAICEALGLPKHASNDKCVEAIFAVQPVKVETATQAPIITKAVDDAEVIYVGETAIALITYDDEDRCPWVVSINGAEWRRFKTMAQATSTTTWHYKNATLPALQSQPQEEEEVVVENCAGEKSAVYKRAREIQVGDRIIQDGKQWKVQSIGSQRINFQAYHSVIDGVCYRFMLIPVDYQYQEYVWCDRSPESDDWQKYWVHHDRETARLKSAVKWLTPLSEAEFLLAA